MRKHVIPPHQQWCFHICALVEFFIFLISNQNTIIEEKRRSRQIIIFQNRSKQEKERES